MLTYSFSSLLVYSSESSDVHFVERWIFPIYCNCILQLSFFMHMNNFGICICDEKNFRSERWYQSWTWMYYFTPVLKKAQHSDLKSWRWVERNSFLTWYATILPKFWYPIVCYHFRWYLIASAPTSTSVKYGNVVYELYSINKLVNCDHHWV